VRGLRITHWGGRLEPFEADEPVPGRLVGVARATMIMAAQQQQQ